MIFDTNVYLKLCFEPAENLINLAAKNSLIAPSLLKLELINVLRKYHFLKAIPFETLEKYENYLFDLVDVFVPDEELLKIAKKFSYQLNHPLYDCVFFALAYETNNVFCSYDQKLTRKAELIGVRTLDLTTL